MAWTEVLLKALVTGLIILVLGAVFTLLLVRVRLWLTVQADKEHAVLLTNRGNCRSQYYLMASSPEPGLAFTFLLNKIPLVEISGLTQDLAELPTETVNNKKAASTPAVNTLTASKSLQKAGGKAGSVAAMLGSIASFLPGKLGNGLRDQAAQMRSVQVKSARAAQAPARVNRQLAALHKTSGMQSQTPQAAVKQSEGATAGTIQMVSKSGTDFRCAQTAELLPGESVALTLRIGTTHTRYPAGSFNYIIVSQQATLDFPESDIPPLSKGGTVYFEQIDWWRYWLLPVMNSVLILMALVLAIYSLSLLWQ
jgi:hypothetical protein